MSGHVVIKPAQDNKNEHYYHALLYTLLVAFGADIHAEEPSAKGCSDLTLKMPKGIPFYWSILTTSLPNYHSCSCRVFCLSNA